MILKPELSFLIPLLYSVFTELLCASIMLMLPLDSSFCRSEWRLCFSFFITRWLLISFSSLFLAIFYSFGWKSIWNSCNYFPLIWRFFSFPLFQMYVYQTYRTKNWDFLKVTLPRIYDVCNTYIQGILVWKFRKINNIDSFFSSFVI